MKNTYFQANLMSLNKINVLLFTGINMPYNPSFFLKKDDEKEVKLHITRHISNNNVNIFELEMKENFEYGHQYIIILEGFPRVNVEVSEAVNFPEFEDRFYYSGNDLGAIYAKEETKFNVWAPLATEVVLKIEINGRFEKFFMERTEKGVYRYTLKGDHLNARYHYLVTNSGITSESNDPWGKGVSFNSEYSAVVDLEPVKAIKKVKPKTKINQNSDAIIYEACIRDFSEDKNTNIVNKGKFLALSEEKRTTKGGNPAGLDYLKYLGITHLQILPVMDFYGNDDKDMSLGYNWGYNPISFFAIEGSYCTNPEDPMNRLIEFKTMVEALHKNNIRVVMDVVYNHLYEFMYTSFEKVVPNYFYRRRPNGLQACASGCGDDYASEKKMARKAVVESLEYFTDIFDIDGFRFDLMGLMDIETINQGFKNCKNIKNDVIFYGEGWNMGAELPMAQKACSDNADKMPGIGFFNDLYRDTLRGGNFQDSIRTRGYIGGNLDNQNVVNYVLRGSAINFPFKHRFLAANQSLHYVECHDNNTLYDKLSFSNEGEDEDTILNRVIFATRLVMISIGIPFIHMGQEIGLSKSGLDNTYNVLKVNNMDWALVDKRFDMVKQVAQSIALRKQMYSFLNADNITKVNAMFDTAYWNNGILAFSCERAQIIKPYKKMAIIINPLNETKTYELDDYYKMVVDVTHRSQPVFTKNGMIPPLSIQLLYKK